MSKTHFQCKNENKNVRIHAKIEKRISPGTNAAGMNRMRTSNCTVRCGFYENAYDVIKMCEKMAAPILSKLCVENNGKTLQMLVPANIADKILVGKVMPRPSQGLAHYLAV